MWGKKLYFGKEKNLWVENKAMVSHLLTKVIESVFC